MTFDVLATVFQFTRYGWKHHYEVFAVCRECHKPTDFVIVAYRSNDRRLNDAAFEAVLEDKQVLVKYTDSSNDMFSVEGFISLKDHAKTPPPEHLPETIETVFREGIACQAIECFNAAATMYRLCLDLATRELLPDEANTTVAQPSKHQRRNLKPRLDWLFDQGRLPEALLELSDCVREEGNDGAHAGNLTDRDADDLLDFTFTLLERLYTEPQKLALAKARRDKRRGA